MPISSPLALTRAPPELPGLIAAEVWMALVTTVSLEVWPSGEGLASLVLTGRLSAETMPVVTVPERPSGLPTAMTGSPTLRAALSPRLIGVRSLGAEVSLMTARSVEGSVPTMVALEGAAVGEGDGDRAVAGGVADDVVVGQDVAAVVEDDAGARRRSPAGSSRRC